METRNLGIDFGDSGETDADIRRPRPKNATGIGSLGIAVLQASNRDYSPVSKTYKRYECSARDDHG